MSVNDILRIVIAGPVSVDDEESGGGSGVTWANDLATSTDHHQWVSAISGTHGTGATCLERTGLTILQNQGGTLAAPTVETPWAIQPIDGAKAPFGFLLGGAKFNATWDSVGQLAYNPQAAVAAEPSLFVNMEQDFEAGPGIHTTEIHFGMQRATALGGVATRCISARMNRATASVETTVNFNTIGGGADPVRGGFVLNDSNGNQEWIRIAGQVADVTLGPNDFYAAGPTPSLTGAIRLPKAVAAGILGGISYRSGLDGYDISMCFSDALDQIRFGQVNPSGGGNPQGATNFRFVGRTQAQGGSYVAPLTDVDMDLGISGSSWRQIWGTSLSSAAELDITAGTLFKITASGAGNTGSKIQADAVQLVNHAGGTTAAWLDLLNDPGHLLFYPNANNTGKVGKAGNAFAEVHATALFAGAIQITSGVGTPNGAVVGSPGDLYLNTSGGAATTLWVKESGAATNTGWVGK
jgi:hypothetical protein